MAQRNLRHPQSKKKEGNNLKKGTTTLLHNGWKSFGAPALKRVPDLPKIINVYDKQFII